MVLEQEKSVLSAVNNRDYSDTVADGIEVNSSSDSFGGIMVVGSLNASTSDDGPNGGGEPSGDQPLDIAASSDTDTTDTAASSDTADTAEEVESTETEEQIETLNYTVKNATFNFLTESDGSDVSDFTGYGSVLSAFGNVRLNIDNVTIHTKGVAKAAIYADDNADIIVNQSSVNVEGGELYEGYQNTANTEKLVAPPWVLGITGTARGTNMLGSYSTTTVIDSDFESSAWGVMSTDGCENVVLTTINTVLKNTSPDGYGTYAIGDAKEYFYGTTFDVGTYPVIITSGYALFTSYTDGQNIDINKDDAGEDNDLFADGLAGTSVDTVSSEEMESGETIQTTVDSQFGVMWHGDGAAIIEKNTEFHTKNAAFLIKDGTADIKVDNSTIDVEDGVILQMMDNDDNTVGMSEESNMVFNTTFSEEEGFPATDTNTTGSTTVNASFTNVDLEGNMYNATGYAGTAKGMSITLGEGAKLTGVISSATAMHVWMQLDEESERYEYMLDENGDYIQATNFTIDEYYNLGHVVNQVWYNGGNDAYVTLDDGAEWTVTDTSLLSGLTITNGTIKAPSGQTVVMTVDGEETPITEGTYTGKIILSITSEE